MYIVEGEGSVSVIFMSVWGIHTYIYMYVYFAAVVF